jgi:hypothetical protein
MDLKNKTITGLLLAGLATLASTAALANQEIQGEFFTVSSGPFGGYCYAENESAKFNEEILKKIRSEAMKVCGGRDFSIDKPRISVFQNRFVLDECDRHFTMSGTATVFCKN